MSLMSPFAMRAFPVSELPQTLVGRLQFCFEMSRPREVVDDDGEPTGEVLPPYMTFQQAYDLLRRDANGVLGEG